MLLLHALVERRREVAVLDLVERRRLKRQRAGRQERVGAACCRTGACGEETDRNGE